MQLITEYTKGLHRHYKLGSLVLISAMLFCSCAKDYENVPLGQQQTLDLTFDTKDSAGTYAIRYLNQVYSDALVNGHNRVSGDYLDAATDDALSSSSSLSDVEKIANGAYTSTNTNADDCWASAYAAIRSATVFIVNIDRVPLLEQLPDGRPARSAYKAEARFLRAWSYFRLVRRYGGVPLLGDQVYQLTDDMELPRSSFGDCIDYIVSQLDLAADSLRSQTEVNSTSYGRITKEAAMAVKAKVLLLAASPLYNGENVDPSNNLTGYASYDKNRWQLAADAAKKIIDLGYYALMPSFSSVFLNQNQPVGSNTENIFWRQVGNNQDVEKNNAPIGYTTAGGNGRTSPSENLVEAFPMISGLSINDNGSGYNQSDPYVNRDPRLAATVFFDGQSWINRYVELFEGGLDRPGGTVQQTKTGYYMRKFMGDFSSVSGSQYSNTLHDWVYIRYAGILLDYAEALNELGGPSSDVYQILFDLRHRAGIEPGDNGYYGLSTSLDQTSMRAAIHNERRIEMAFEEQRYWDLRRWKEASTVYSQPVWGMDIQKTGSGQLYYNPEIVFTPSFDASKMYFYPIPYNEVVKDEQMIQNPGWK
ncbi:Starch-binding associating with outer membrane [Arachidicoccus rhizosphaerae]|uniref:Starch-binding associating with outer membrane n=1 Tax=Arachidicoccus rhizosphaerae TaxID=551991 RepID=A0A1H4BCZ1_9BACT|nr:RagB/SusD family nutrient uptake outer membrane protein [Arachidicoccus rhizosphaerae]SEA45977.1 Starch-binding associating with outer membrane [Arachidicoccus rhizosphaerae]